MVEVGNQVEGKIIQIGSKGYEVDLNSGDRGFMYKYLSGDLSIKFGDTYNFIVLDIHEKDKKIYLSSNPIIIKAEPPFLTCYDSALDHFYMGFVEKCFKSYLIVKFFNNVSGLLHVSEMIISEKGDLESAYPIGTPIRVRVLSKDPHNKRLSLTMHDKQYNCSQSVSSRLLSLTNPVISGQTTFTVKDNKIISGTVVVPNFHLSDFPEHYSTIKKVLQSGASYNGVYVGKDLIAREDICTLKQSIVRSVETKTFPTSISDITLGHYYPGFVTKISQVGVNIMIGFNLVGFFPASVDHNFTLGESVLLYVSELDRSRNRIILSFPNNKEYGTYIPPHCTSSAIFLSYLKEHQLLTHTLLDNFIFKRGKKHKVVIVKRHKAYYKCILGAYEVILFRNKNKHQIGDTITAYTLFWTFNPLKIYSFPKKSIANVETNEFSVAILKCFQRFSIGMCESTFTPLFVLSKQLFSHEESSQIKEKSVVKCEYITSFDGYHLVRPIIQETKIGQRRQLVCKILEITNTDLKVLTSNKVGYIHVSNVCNTQEGDRPLTRFKINDSVHAFIIPKRFRYSTDSPVSTSKRFELKLSHDISLPNISSLKPGDKVMGFVSSIDNRRFYVEVFHTIKGYINRVDLELHSSNYEKKFTIGSAIELIIFKINYEKSIYIFVKSIVPQPIVGEYVRGLIYKHSTCHSLLVDLPNTITAKIHVCNIYDSYRPDPFTDYAVGLTVRARVKEVLVDGTYSLSLKSETNIPVPIMEIGSVHSSYVFKISPRILKVFINDHVSATVDLKESRKKYGVGWNKHLREYSVMDVLVKKIISPTHLKVLPFYSSCLSENVESWYLDNDNALKLNGEFDWKDTKISLTEPILPIEEVKHINDSEKSKGLSEIEIRKIESKLCNNSLLPTSDDDFNRQVISSPNSSIVWINYMCFYVQALEIDKARKICERALKSMSPNEINERLNLWKAYINMECLFGTPETLNSTYNNAKLYTNKKHIISHLIDLYHSIEQHSNCEKECLSLLKLYPKSKKSYLKYAKFLANNSRFIEMKQLMKRAIQILNKRKHIFITLQFGLLEFKYGDPQRGSSLIESILNNYPNRTDVWFTYIDQLVKSSQISSARFAFEKLCTIPFKSSRKKSILTKYLSFEQQHGTRKSIAKLEELIATL